LSLGHLQSCLPLLRLPLYIADIAAAVAANAAAVCRHRCCYYKSCLKINYIKIASRLLNDAWCLLIDFSRRIDSWIAYIALAFTPKINFRRTQ